MVSWETSEELTIILHLWISNFFLLDPRTLFFLPLFCLIYFYVFPRALKLIYLEPTGVSKGDILGLSSPSPIVTIVFIVLFCGLLESIIHFLFHWRPNSDFDYQKFQGLVNKSRDWLLKTIVGLKQSVCNSNSNYHWLLYVISLINMDFIIMNSLRKLNEKWSPLGLVPWMLATSPNHINSCFLSSRFSFLSHYHKFLHDINPCQLGLAWISSFT